jgi:16S rRNA (guanine527-N7)-methyltransferase
LGEPVSPALATTLLRYLDLLARWNSTYNLTSVRTREGMLAQHLLDCLAVVGPLRRQLAALPPDGQARSCLDVGSGGGLPGVVLTACLPSIEVHCVDSVAKKAAFVRQVSAELGMTRLHALHARVEALQAAPFTLITSRAFASLADFTQLTKHLLAENGLWMAMKGKLPRDEIDELPAEIEVFHVEQLTVPGLEAQRCLVWMKLKTHP